MEVVYTVHSEEKLTERKLDKKLIESVIEKPDDTEIARFERMIASRAANGKVLRVVYERDGNVYIVITAYYTKKGRY